MSTTFAPFVQWGQYTSQDKNNPDVLRLQIVDPETFETAYSVNVRVYLKENSEVKEMVLPLKYHDSKNPSLMNQWDKSARKGLARQNAHFVIKTWKETSKNGYPIRRYILEF